MPQFILFSRLGWVGTCLPLIVPGLFGNAFFIFLFRQWFRNLPPHLFESAELEGATPFQAFRHIALPLAGPAVAAVTVFAFVASWNDFLGPLVYLRAPDTFTMSLGMASFQGVHVNDVHFSVAMALIALVPPIAHVRRRPAVPRPRRRDRRVAGVTMPFRRIGNCRSPGRRSSAGTA